MSATKVADKLIMNYVDAYVLAKQIPPMSDVELKVMTGYFDDLKNEAIVADKLIMNYVDAYVLAKRIPPMSDVELKVMTGYFDDLKNEAIVMK
uniref:Uncharacterized protein n=1 Tax=Parascaris univalens TaxID=6257 RepID=A0A915B094_PARUN